MSKAHLLYYKNDVGEWVPLPHSIESMYDVYKQYCLNNNITYVDERTYYETIGKLGEYTEQLQETLGNIQDVSAIREAVESLGEGALPTNLGGTGRAFADFAALVNSIKESLQMSGTFVESAELDETNRILDEHTTAASNRFQNGTADPNIVALPADCEYYFQFEA